MRDIVRSKTERELVRVKIHDGNAFWNEIGVNAGVSKLMLLSLNLLLPVLVYAARHSLTAVRHKLMLPGITYYCWATAKAKTVNGERQIQALVDKKKVIITEKSVRSDLMLEDAEGTECLPNDVIFEQLTLMSAKTIAWNEFSSTMASAIISPEDMGEDSAAPTDSHSTPIITQPSSSKPQKKKSRRKQRKDSGPTEPIPDEATNEEPISTPSCDPPQSVLDLEEAKTAQAKEITSLKKRVKQLEKRRKSRTSGLKRLRKVGSASRVESSNDVSLGAQEDASKQGRKIADLDADAEVTLIDETQERYDEEMLFDVQDDLQGEEVVAEKEVAEKEVSAADPVTTADEVVTTASATTTVDELTLAQTLIEIKAAKPKAVTTAATTITTAVASTRPKAKGIVFHDQEEQASAFTPIVSSSQSSQLPQTKDKGKGKMVEPEKPLKKKDQIALDEELALRLQAEEQAELEKERVAQEEASRAAIIKELDSIQAMIDADEQLAARLQAEEQEQFSIEEKSRMLVEMIAERKKFFAAQRAAEQRSKPPTKNQIRNRMCTYLKNMGGYKHNQLKGRSYEEIQKLFDKAYKQVSSFVPMDSEVVKSSVTRTEGSSKRAGDELESDKSKKQKIDEHVEAEKDDQEEAEMKRHIEIVKDDEVAIDAIPLATKPPVIVEYKIDKDGRMGYFKLIRADGSSKAKHENTRPEEDYERVLWGDLKLQLLSDYYCWKEYADRDEMKDLLENKNTYEDKY
ncbi:hypothetical protein Tco_1123341 [Tanacetum coccineum]|uniref:Uncharacterized protein n=1 Tax=Tanacetum coccineum TaxID=301880 RepID=A0ABQ5J335_9ASTR